MITPYQLFKSSGVIGMGEEGFDQEKKTKEKGWNKKKALEI